MKNWWHCHAPPKRSGNWSLPADPDLCSLDHACNIHAVYACVRQTAKVQKIMDFLEEPKKLGEKDLAAAVSDDCRD